VAGGDECVHSFKSWICKVEQEREDTEEDGEEEDDEDDTYRASAVAWYDQNEVGTVVISSLLTKTPRRGSHQA
jgi:hypothetical protein